MQEDLLTLFLMRNRLSGTIPSQVSALDQLQSCSLEDDKVPGQNANDFTCSPVPSFCVGKLLCAPPPPSSPPPSPPSPPSSPPPPTRLPPLSPPPLSPPSPPLVPPPSQNVPPKLMTLLWIACACTALVSSIFCIFFVWRLFDRAQHRRRLDAALVSADRARYQHQLSAHTLHQHLLSSNASPALYTGRLPGGTARLPSPVGSSPSVPISQPMPSEPKVAESSQWPSRQASSASRPSSTGDGSAVIPDGERRLEVHHETSLRTSSHNAAQSTDSPAVEQGVNQSIDLVIGSTMSTSAASDAASESLGTILSGIHTEHA